MVNLCKSMNLNQFVNFTGFVQYEKFFEIISTADICVNPEFKNDFTDKSTMLKIMDYMTFGKPIVQYDTKEGRITAKESAIYVKDNDVVMFANAIINLLKTKNTRKIALKLIYQINKKN